MQLKATVSKSLKSLLKEMLAHPQLWENKKWPEVRELVQNDEVKKLSKSSLQDHTKIFKYFNKIPLAMTAHIKYLSWDKYNIATFSSYIIDNIIRKKIGFKGLIISDDLEMNANIYNIKDAIKLANFSKLDVILDCSSDLDKYSEIINSFNVSNNYVNVHKSNKLQQYKKKLDFKSININHYHELYNQLLKINGF